MVVFYYIHPSFVFPPKRLRRVGKMGILGNSRMKLEGMRMRENTSKSTEHFSIFLSRAGI